MRKTKSKSKMLMIVAVLIAVLAIIAPTTPAGAIGACPGASLAVRINTPGGAPTGPGLSLLRSTPDTDKLILTAPFAPFDPSVYLQVAAARTRANTTIVKVVETAQYDPSFPEDVTTYNYPGGVGFYESLYQSDPSFPYFKRVLICVRPGGSGEQENPTDPFPRP